MKKMNKKAAIEMSINTIVVLVLALAMLGVGLFVVQMVREGAGQFDVSKEVENRIYAELEGSDANLALDDNEITVKKREKGYLYYGIRNVFVEQKKFNVNIDCDYGVETGEITGDDSPITFSFLPTVTLNSKDNRAFRATINTLQAQSDFYGCKVNVTYLDDGQETDYALEYFNVIVE